MGLGLAALGLGGIWVHEHRPTVERARVLGLQRCALAALRARLAAEDAYPNGDVSALRGVLVHAGEPWSGPKACPCTTVACSAHTTRANGWPWTRSWLASLPSRAGPSTR